MEAGFLRGDQTAEKRIYRYNCDEEIQGLVHSLSDEELAYLCIGRFVDAGSKSFIGDAGITVAGAAGETCGRFRERGVPSLVMADGPAGIRIAPTYGKDEEGIFAVDEGLVEQLKELLPETVLKQFGLCKERRERHGEIFYQYCSAIPVGTALAQSFNEEIVEACGNLVAEEMELFGIHLWLAPALNIHRNPLCGRNFEYYSEDPLVSGRMAAAMTRGVEKHPGRGVTLKHFACNNQETNRMRNNSLVSQRALRDIYLKGFEIAIRECAPAALMTSYNLLNGEHTSQRRDLLKNLLRQEWGYEGLIMSDWVITIMITDRGCRHPAATASGMIAAGNDLVMPGGSADHADIMSALRNIDAEYPVSRLDLEECAVNVLRTVYKLTHYGSEAQI